MSVDTLRQRKQAAGTATETHAVKQVAGKTISTNTSGTVDYADVSPTFTPPSFTIKDLLGEFHVPTFAKFMPQRVVATMSLQLCQNTC